MKVTKSERGEAICLDLGTSPEHNHCFNIGLYEYAIMINGKSIFIFDNFIPYSKKKKKIFHGQFNFNIEILQKRDN